MSGLFSRNQENYVLEIIRDVWLLPIYKMTFLLPPSNLFTVVNMLLSEEACHGGHSSVCVCVCAIVWPSVSPLVLTYLASLTFRTFPSSVTKVRGGFTFFLFPLKVTGDGRDQGAGVIKKNKMNMSIKITNTSLWNTLRNLIKHLLLYLQFT